MGELRVSLENMGNMENMENMEKMENINQMTQLRFGQCQTTSAALIQIKGNNHLLHRMFFSWRSGRYTKANTNAILDRDTNTLYTTWCTESFSSCQSDRAEAFLVRLSSHFHLFN